MVFRLNWKIRSSRRNRAEEVDSPNIHFEYTPKSVLFGKSEPEVLDFVSDIVSIRIDDIGNMIFINVPSKDRRN